jgi:hypothetical protein
VALARGLWSLLWCCLPSIKAIKQRPVLASRCWGCGGAGGGGSITRGLAIYRKHCLLLILLLSDISSHPTPLRIYMRMRSTTSTSQLVFALVFLPPTTPSSSSSSDVKKKMFCGLSYINALASGDVQFLHLLQPDETAHIYHEEHHIQQGRQCPQLFPQLYSC